MKLIKLLSHSLIALVLFSSCSKDEEFGKKEFPIIKTNPVSEINSTGITLSAELVNIGTDNILDYGYELYGNNDLIKVSLKDIGQSIENLTFRITTDLKAGKEYVCKAYIKTEYNLVYGNSVSFESQGSLATEILDYFPKTGPDGTTVTMLVRNLGFYKPEVKVKVADKYAEITELKDDSIKFIIPDTHLKSPYEISLIARETLTFTEPFTPIYPIINSFDKSEVFTGEKLIITGENFLINGDSAQFYIGSKIPVIELSEQRAVVRITGKDYFVLGREEVELTLNVRSGAKSSYYFDQKLKIKFPWKILPIIPTNSIYKKQSFSYDNKGYIYEPNSLELLEYNPTDFKWRTITNYPGNFDEGSLCLQMNGIFYKLGGIANSTDNYNHWEYDFNTNIWSQKADIPFIATEAKYFILNNTLYIINNSGEVWKYDPISHNYLKLNNSPDKDIAYAFVCNNEAYLITYGETYRYNPISDQWFLVSSNPFVNPNSETIKTVGAQTLETAFIIDAYNGLYRFNTITYKWELVFDHVTRSPRTGMRTCYTIDNLLYILTYYNTEPNSYGLAHLRYYDHWQEN